MTNFYKQIFNSILIADAKILSFIIKKFKLGNGSTWPGHYILKFNKQFIRQILENNRFSIIIVAGTNGKTTTSGMIRAILEGNGYHVIQNESGANLLNGIASTLALHSTIFGRIKADFAIFEVDENALPGVLSQVTPDYLVLLNLFRDQLDRYGEINIIAGKWNDAIKNLPKKTQIIANADDPEIAILSKKSASAVSYFGLDDVSLHQQREEHAADTTHCPNCGNKLQFTKRFFSHLGEWHCTHCHFKRPDLALSSFPLYPLNGTYNKYNALAAVLASIRIGLPEEAIKKSLNGFRPAFGRQEIIEYGGKNIQIFLSKNPTGFNEALRTIKSLHAKHILFVLNDRIPDGRDVSWIWDVDFESLVSKDQQVYVSGDRAYDMALRLKYTHPVVTHIDTYSELKQGAIFSALEHVSPGETLYILPTYSAMLEVREILTGKKIL